MSFPAWEFFEAAQDFAGTSGISRARQDSRKFGWRRRRFTGIFPGTK
jgi:hypothetical protein